MISLPLSGLTWPRLPLGPALLSLGLLVVTMACRQPDPPVRSYLEGRVVVDSGVTASDDYSDFRLLLVHATGRRLDTLGHARTDRQGHFQMPIAAPERGLYPLSLWGRDGRRRLAATDYVVASGDSGTLHAELPVSQRRPLRPESVENRALRGYRNAMAMHRRMMTRRLQADAYQPNALVQNIRLTSSTLWSLRDQFPGTYAAEFAAVESLSLLEGWNDSLVVARAHQIEPSSPHYPIAVRVARRAEARRHGQRAALALLDSFQAQASLPQHRAAVEAVRIQAFLDSLQLEAALASAQRLRADYPDTPWASWARRVRYESQNLMPGMQAPDFTAFTLLGDTLSLGEFQGRPVLLEFFRPGSDLYPLQRPLRNALYRATRADSVAFISVSVEPDTLVNRAFLQNQSLPGHTILAPKGTRDPLVTSYNVVDEPTWFLIDAHGTIVNRYRTGAFPTLRQHLMYLLSGDETPSPAPAP